MFQNRTLSFMLLIKIHAFIETFVKYADFFKTFISCKKIENEKNLQRYYVIKNYYS